MKKPNLDQLYEIASHQQGFFTAHQASKCGYSRQLQVYYVKKGEWVRHARSIFKLLCFSDHCPFPNSYYITLLWSENQQGEYEGVFAYMTALFVHGLVDTAPEDIHFIVPKKFRRNSPPPARIRFHRRELAPESIETVHGLRVINVFSAVKDLLLRNSLDERTLQVVLEKAQSKGKITIDEIEQLFDHVQQRTQIAQTLRAFIDSRSEI